MFITSAFRIQQLITLQANPPSKNTPGLDAGVREVTDYQYFCANDVQLGGVCTSGERVSRARAVCSYCIVSGFPV